MLTTSVDLFGGESNTKSSGSRSEPVPAEGLAGELLAMLDRWHAHREIWDDSLDAQIHRMNLEVLTTNKPRLDWGKKGQKYLTPSSANSDKRELYLKLTGAPRDIQKDMPHRGRWRRLGTAWGDLLQRDLLFIEKYHKKEFGEAPAFVPEYLEINGRQYPAWERFAQRIAWVEHRGHKIPILGQPDGILKHTATGQRVGLEIKSKQTTAAQTGYFSMKEAKLDHKQQAILYTVMYGTPENPIDKYIILYGNLSKKAWDMTEEDYEKNPDLRAFEFDITDEDRLQLLDYLADVMDAVETQIPPPLDLEKWTFNNYKTAAALSLSEEELQKIRDQVIRYRRSRLTDKQKQPYIDALQFIEKVRKDNGV